MKTSHILLALSLLTVAFASVPAAGTHEDPDKDCTITSTEPTAQEEGYAIFVDEVASDDYLFSVWIYEETNGFDGIQRSDSYTEAQGTTDEDCGHGYDTIVF